MFHSEPPFVKLRFNDPLNKRVIANQCAHWCGNPHQVSGNLGGSPRQPIVWLGIDELFKQFVKLKFEFSSNYTVVMKGLSIGRFSLP